MAKGYKTGGRKAGTPNRKTQEVADILAATCCDPIERLAHICNGEKITTTVNGTTVEVSPTVDQILRAASELAEYVYPKRKAIEQRRDNGEKEYTPQERVQIFRELLIRAGVTSHIQ